MDGVGHSTLLKFFVDNNINSNKIMSEQSPTIESETPRLQKLRSVTKTTCNEPECEYTSNKDTDNGNITEVHNFNEGRDDISILITKETEQCYTIDDKKYVETPTAEGEKNKYGDFAKSSVVNKEEKDSTDEKGESLTSEENAVTSKDAFVYSPVITVTKEESTLTKGDLKLQKVVVSEDISDESTSKNGKLSATEACSPTNKFTEIQSEVLAVSIRTDKNIDENNAKEKSEDDGHKDPKTKQTKIPKLKLKQVIEKIKKENQEKRIKKDPEPSEQKRRSSIPRLKDIKSPTQNIKQDLIQNKKDQELESPKADDEFDKLYEEIIESEASNNVPSPEKLCDPIKLESKFEEIIHAYDENNVQPISTEKIKSKIPLLKRKSEQEIEIPPQQKLPFNRSHSEDPKNKIRTAVSKDVKSDVGTVKHDDSSTTKISENRIGIKTEVISKNFNEPLKSINTTIVKKTTTQKSVEAKEHFSSSRVENVVKVENASHNKVKDTTKCKIPVTINAKDTLETKINSATLNKYPTRINVNRVSRSSDSKAIDANNPVNEVSPLPENKKHFLETEQKNNSTVESLKSNDDTTTSAQTDDSKIPHEFLSKNENEHNFTVNNNLDVNDKDVKESNGDWTVKEPTALNVSVQLLKKNNDSDDKHANKFEKDPVKDGKMHYESEELIVNNGRGQIMNKIELTLESPIRTTTNENNTTKEVYSTTHSITAHTNVQESDNLNNPKQILFNATDVKVDLVKDPLESNANIPENNQTTSLSDNKQNFLENPLVNNKDNLLEKGNIPENLHIKETDIEEKQEEDIIMLKGKVHRVIRRLDSKDHKTIKKDPDDLPKEVSVISKIALFERSDTKDPVPEVIEDNAQINKDMVTDKPKVVNEVLKTDINQNEINYSDESVVNMTSSEKTVNNDKATIRNDLEIRKVNKTFTTSGFKIRNSLSDGKINRTISSVAGENNDVFINKDDQSKEVWKEYRRKKEAESDMRRARSLAELDAPDALRGRVRELVLRLSSVERPPVPAAGTTRGRPRGGSVAERIALYERKLTPTRGDARAASPAQSSAPLAAPLAAPPAAPLAAPLDDELRARLGELQRARATYGRIEDMPYIELSDGGKMPVLALGTATLDPALVGAVVRAAIDLGFRAIDAAYVYGNEREVGAAIRDKIRDGTVARSELFIINKLWSTCHGRELAQQACQRSLQTMGLDYFDLYLVHNPMSFKEGPDPVPRIAGVLQYSAHDYLEAWFGVEALAARGLARRGGLSNFNSRQVARVLDKARLRPVVNQVECHPYLTQLRLEEFCLSRNIRLSCFGVLGSKGTPPAFTSGLPPVIDDPLVQVMAAGLGLTPAQLLISYQLQLGRNVVVQSSSGAHLAEALAVASAASALPKLEASHVTALNALNRNKRIFTFKGMGDTHKNYPFKIPF